MIQKANILSIDPGHREVGYAHFDGEQLVDFGVKSLRRVHLKTNPLELLNQSWFDSSVKNGLR